jgi:hypothetical protein
MTPSDQTTGDDASAEPAYTLLYWGGAGLPDNHQNDCYLRRGALYKFTFTSGQSQLANFRSFDGTTLVLTQDGMLERHPITTLDQVYPAPGNGAWGVPEKGGPGSANKLGEGPNG